jgi:hypothetical protein
VLVCVAANKIYFNRDNPGRARSWSGRLKLSFRAVWDSAKMPGLCRTVLAKPGVGCSPDLPRGFGE